jgi:hypothetical protein
MIFERTNTLKKFLTVTSNQTNDKNNNEKQSTVTTDNDGAKWGWLRRCDRLNRELSLFMVHITTMIVTFVIVMLFSVRKVVCYGWYTIYRQLSSMAWQWWGWLLTSRPFRTAPTLPCLVHIPNNKMSWLNRPLPMFDSTGKAVIVDKPFFELLLSFFEMKK